MNRRLAVLLAICLAGGGIHADPPPAPKLSGYRVTVEGGEEGSRTYHYDDQGKPIGGAARTNEAPGRGVESPRPKQPSNQGAEVAPRPSTPTRTLTTADGRPLPFTVSGSTGGKTVDATVDADSALRNFARPSDLGDRRYETRMAELSSDPRFSTADRFTLGTWTTTFSGLGSRRADIALEDGLGAEVRAKDTVDIKAVDQPRSPWSRTLAAPSNWEERLEGSAELGSRRVAREEIATMGTRAVAGEARRLEQLSMQDLNRYQFRRARSSEPGLPVVRPGTTGEVRTTRPGG